MFENKLLSNSSNNALFGYTGLVGSTLLTFYNFEYLYNSKNISIDKIHDDNYLNYEKELNNLEILFNKIENDN